MRKNPNRAKAEEPAPDPLFIGTKLSNQELQFLLEHLGEPSIVAFPEDMEDDEIPEGVNPDAVISILDSTYRLDLMQKAMLEQHGEESGIAVWVGFDVLKEVCNRTLAWNATRDELKRRTRGASNAVRLAAGAPSLCMWDPTTNIPVYGAEGADSGFVQTAFDDNGNRVSLSTALRSTGIDAIRDVGSMVGFLRGKKREQVVKDLHSIVPDGLETHTDGDNGTVKCPICGKAETFSVRRADSKRKATQAIVKHLRNPESRREMHRILLLRVQSGRVINRPKPEPTEEVEA